MIRVLVVDDSPTARSLVVAILSSDPGLDVVGEATNGIEAIALTKQLRPDVVAMDVNMPRMDGFEATKEIMIEAPTPIVIVTNSKSEHYLDKSMQALRSGAVDILEKPAGPADLRFEERAQQLIAGIKAMAHVKLVRHWRPAAVLRLRPQSAARLCQVRLIALGASTGGPAALHSLLLGLPRDFAVPILVVQHISQGFVQGLADWLDKMCELNVKVAQAGDPLQPGIAYLAADDRHLGVDASGRVVLSAAPPIAGFRPSATALFESVAQSFGPAVAAVILTGMGEDGVAGLHAVRRAGGIIYAQNEDSSVVFGMPGAAVAAGLADEVLPPEEIAARLLELVQAPP